LSRIVEKERIKQFRTDRALLPYDDIVIAQRMKVDRSNYSKAVNKGPITNSFLTKFYLAFGKELDEKVEAKSTSEKKELLKRFDQLEQHVLHLLEVNNMLMEKVNQLSTELGSLIEKKLEEIKHFRSQKAVISPTIMLRPPISARVLVPARHMRAKRRALKEFGENLRKYRVERGLSLRELSETCGIDNSKIGKIEKGLINITLTTVLQLAVALEVPPVSLLDSWS